MLKRRFIIKFVALMLLSVIFLLPASATLAAHDRLVIRTLATWSCDPMKPNAAYWDIDPLPGTMTHITLYNPRVLTQNEQFIQVYVNNFGFSSPPENTYPGDQLIYRVELFDSDGRVYAADQIAYNCTTGQQAVLNGPDVPEDQQPTFTMAQPASNAGVEPLLDIPYNDQLACGVFSVSWHGIHVISPEIFSPCAQYWPDVTVACLNQDGEWQSEEVRDPTLHTEGLHVLITQTGTCAVFPAADDQVAESSPR